MDPYDLYRLDVSGLTVGLSALIPTSFHVFHAAASPDGKRLALEAYTSVPYANPDLYVMDVQPGSTHVHCLVPKPPGASQAVGFSWSPNGKRILFENALPSSDEGPVSVTDLTSPITSWQLSPQGNIGLVEGWTHDARFVAFRSGTDLLVTDLNAGPPFTPQTIATDTTFEAAFIPNTHTLVYISGGLLFARNFDTTGSAVQLTSTPSVAKWISLSADGTRLAWASDVTGTTNLASQLFMLEVVNGLPTGTPVPVFPSSVNYDNIQEVQWAPGSNRLIAIAELSLVQSGLYFVDATVFPPSFHAVAAPSGSESAREPQWSSNGKLVTYLFGVAAQLYLSDLSQATPGAPQSIAAPLIQAGPRFSPAGDLISLRTYGKVNIANTANFSQGLTVVSPTPVPSIIPGASTMRWSPSGVLFFLGNYQSSKVISLHAWKGSGLATVVSPPSVYEVRDYLFVPQ